MIFFIAEVLKSIPEQKPQMAHIVEGISVRDISRDPVGRGCEDLEELAKRLHGVCFLNWDGFTAPCPFKLENGINVPFKAGIHLERSYKLFYTYYRCVISCLFGQYTHLYLCI